MCPCVGVFDFVVSVVDFVFDFVVDLLFLWLTFDFVFDFWFCVCRSVCIRGRKKVMRERMRYFCRWRREREREKGAKLEIIKILNVRAIITVHICTVTVAIAHFYTHWYGCFLVKMCKMKCFFYFAWADVVALMWVIFFCHNV